LCYDDAQSDDDFAGAQKLNLIAENAKLLVDEKTSKYESVRHCLKTAEAAERMELGASSKDFIKAGQWKQIKTKLARRFEAYTAMVAAMAMAAVVVETVRVAMAGARIVVRVVMAMVAVKRRCEWLNTRHKLNRRRRSSWGQLQNKRPLRRPRKSGRKQLCV